MLKKGIGRKSTPKRRGFRLLTRGPIVSFARSGREDYCSKPLTAGSKARADKAQSDGTLSLLENAPTCECGARVGARRSPMSAPDACLLVPTLHYPHKALRKRANPSGKPGYYKR